MDTKKHTNNLQKSSVLFLQLGLVLTLFTTYLALELKTEQRVAIVTETKMDPNDIYVFVPVREIEIEREIVKKSKQIAKKQSSSEFVIDDTPIKEDEILPFEPNDPDKDNPVDLGDLPNEGSGDNTLAPDSHLISIKNVQEVPIFPGCEKVKQSKRRACFEKKLHKFVQRKFNGELSNQLGLSSGVQKIYVKFLISKSGDIEVLGAKAPHKKLIIEGKRVVKKLPRMIPGKQNGKEVGVSYMLPIVFKVD